ncbi:hypothetical protein LR48_Vigan01g115800 [Vigna angularis]|uniref:Uncharacterized protein n=1 Tax=Phaseolus angularis TaxID=3914 RepID=A0A0L9TLX9_PHAAN|nr:hypothetical protein LR48_Vigan01g115800 [Vigna angularis]
MSSSKLLKKTALDDDGMAALVCTGLKGAAADPAKWCQEGWNDEHVAAANWLRMKR